MEVSVNGAYNYEIKRSNNNKYTTGITNIKKRKDALRGQLRLALLSSEELVSAYWLNILIFDRVSYY